MRAALGLEEKRSRRELRVLAKLDFNQRRWLMGGLQGFSVPRPPAVPCQPAALSTLTVSLRLWATPTQGTQPAPPLESPRPSCLEAGLQLV